MCFRFELNDKSSFSKVLIVCLFVYAIDHGVNEGEPVDEPYYEQENEDPFHDPEPEGQDLPEGCEDGKFNPSFDACFCPSFYKHNPTAYFIKLHMFCLLENTVG